LERVYLQAVNTPGNGKNGRPSLVKKELDLHA
jgi:hypothetical protein